MVEVNAVMQATKSQIETSVLSSSDDKLRMSLLGQQYVADWRYLLMASGRLWRGHIGTLTAGAAPGLITGGGAGTTIDSDQPEFIIGVGAAYYLIPIEVKVSCVVDLDANAEIGEILLFADRTQAPPAAATGTPGDVVPVNQLDGAGDFPGDAWGGVTTDITDPVMSELLDHVTVSASEFVSNGTATNLTNGIVIPMRMDWKSQHPLLLAGPCSLVMFYGGTAAVTGMASVVVGAVPTSWFPVS